MIKETKMATKAQITKYLEAREKQARELSKIFEANGKSAMARMYTGEVQLAQRTLMLLRGDLKIEEFI